LFEIDKQFYYVRKMVTLKLAENFKYLGLFVFELQQNINNFKLKRSSKINTFRKTFFLFNVCGKSSINISILAMKGKIFMNF